jgi:hypothetical protein
MRRIKQHIEQLEKAEDLLQSATATNARLALMLLDNLAEVFMYDRLRMTFAFDDRHLKIRSRKYPPDRRKRIMSEFQTKAAFVSQELKLIDGDDSELFRIGHQLRNEAYHRGELRESIIVEVARSYLGALCPVIPVLWTGIVAYREADDVAAFLQKRGIASNYVDAGTLRGICDNVLRKVALIPGELGRVLAADILRRIEDIEEDVDILSRDGYMGCRVEDVLKQLQFHKHFLDSVPAPTSDDHKSFIEYHQRRKSLYDRYKPPITVRTIDQWKRRAEILWHAAEPGNSLVKYDSLDRAMADLEERVSDAIFFFDNSTDV